MTPRFSLYLDFMRFFAALVVFVSHFAYARFTDGDYLIIRELNLGSDAVVFFFVLSGLVISYTTEVKDKTLRQYSFNRLTRLYSVAIPALVLTIVFDTVGQSLAPENYAGWWYHAAPMGEQLWRGLSFSNQWLSQNFRIGTNGPYWSLSYEAAYYILFAVLFFVSGHKKYLIALPLIFVFGLSVMLLFPIWLLGIWTYKQIKADTLPRLYAWPCAVLPPLIYAALLAMHIPKYFLVLTKLWLGEDFVNDTLAFSDEFIWNYIIAQLISFHLIGVAALTRRKEKSVSETRAKIIRWLAGATFTIYVVHYPTLQFFDTLIPENIMPLMRHALLFASALAFCFIFAEISERRLKQMRSLSIKLVPLR
ncbi:MAG TPA: acyltransferase [Alphaproteobacteria bacterium]|nr:acyltransferase [Alphaproteobacteria bacterium]